MKITHLVVLAAGLPFAALAEPNDNYTYASAWYNHSSPSGLASGTGNGFGVNVSGQVMDHVFVYGEYQKTSIDSEDANFVRAGGGYFVTGSEQVDVAGSVEFVQHKFGESLNGYGLHGSAIVHALPQLDIYGDVGYVDVDKFDGPEYRIGAAYKFAPQFSGFVSFRRTDLGGDPGDLRYNDVQAGVRYYFGKLLTSGH
jgi:hypothetical protein